MILQPCNVELTKIHYYDRAKSEGNLAISTISREVCQNNFNKNVIIKRNVFGHRWVLRINDGEGAHKKKRKLKVVVYILVFCSIVVAVCFGVFFSVYKSKTRTSDNKINLKPLNNTTDLDHTYMNKTHENQVTVGNTETTSTTIRSRIEKTEQSTTIGYISESPTPNSICGSCAGTQEVCLKIQETEAPKCTKILDRNDPTGCGGLCPINTHFCQILDARGKVYQCTPIKKALVCPNNTFNCGNMCVSQEKRCDGMVHCSNASDEENCVCNLETHFQCGNSTSCLEKKKKCDRKVDCWDKSDEMDCRKAVSCRNEEIPCANGQCVPKERFCDGKFDCMDRTDEPEGCQI